jgi:hypothetical protein
MISASRNEPRLQVIAGATSALVNSGPNPQARVCNGRKPCFFVSGVVIPGCSAPLGLYLRRIRLISISSAYEDMWMDESWPDILESAAVNLSQDLNRAQPRRVAPRPQSRPPARYNSGAEARMLLERELAAISARPNYDAVRSPQSRASYFRTGQLTPYTKPCG